MDGQTKILFLYMYTLGGEGWNEGKKGIGDIEEGAEREFVYTLVYTQWNSILAPIHLHRQHNTATV